MRKLFILSLSFLLLFTACHNPTATNASTTAPVTSLPESTQPEPALTVPPLTEPVQTEPTAPPPTEPTPTEELLLQSMTSEEKVGQLFLARCPDVHALQDIETYHLGGYVLFGRDFEGKSPEQVIRTIQEYQNTAAIPMLIAVDEEGGTVCRVSSHSQFRSNRFPSPRSLYAQGGLNLIFQTEHEKCQLLASLGINVNLAPVCDITTDSNAFMYNRSLGENPEKTGEFISGVVTVMQQNQVGGILKHFPGYGNNTDTHTGIAIDNRSLEELESVDLVPFAAGIDAGCGAIMVSHTFINCLDTVYPASLSPAVHSYLRNNMGFNGVIATDDLYMEAITDLYGPGEAAVLAILAGNDLLCCTEYQVQYAAVLEAVQDGRISQHQLDQAVLRVLRWKQQIGLTLPESTVSSEPDISDPPAEPITTEPAPTTQEPSALYIPGVSVDDVIQYFNEVCLDAEYVHSGDPSKLQKWTQPIKYTIFGAPTEEDRTTLYAFTQWLNGINGFPGISETELPDEANLRIHFCSEADMLTIMGSNYTGLDGAITFWYDSSNVIYDAVICYRTDLDQALRNSVILEEIYNGLGPIQDTSQRTDSIIYAGFSQPQQLSEIDQLLLQLLYHPAMQCGMNAEECNAVIRQLYYETSSPNI